MMVTSSYLHVLGFVLDKSTCQFNVSVMECNLLVHKEMAANHKWAFVMSVKLQY